MDTSAFIVLENTLAEMSAQRTGREEDSRFDECVTVIRACMELIPDNPANGEYAFKMQQALIELAKIARRNGEFIIAARLNLIDHELASPAAQAQHRVA